MQKKANVSINEAMELAGTGKFQYIIVVVSGVAAIATVFENESMSYVLPTAKCDLDISIAEQGFINSVSFIGVIVASHFWGLMADAWGRQRTLRLTLLLTFITSALSSLSWNSWALMTTRFIVGICAAGVKIASISYCADFFTATNISTFLTLLCMINTIVFILQPLLGLAIMPMSFRYTWFAGFSYMPWRLFIFIGSILSCVPYFTLACLPEGPKYSAAMGRPVEALQTLKRVFTSNTGRPNEEYNVESISADQQESKKVRSMQDAASLVWNQTWPLFCRPHLANILMLATLTFIVLGVAQGMQLWMPQIFVYFDNNRNLTLTMCEVINIEQSKSLDSSTIHISSTNCTMAVNPDSLKVLILIGTLTTAIVFIAACTMQFLGKMAINTTWMLACTLATLVLIFSTSFSINVACMVLVISAVPLMSNHAAISGELFPIKYRGMAVSLMLMFGRTGSIAGSNVMASMMFNHCELLFTLNAGVMLVGLLLCWLTLRPQSVDTPL